MSSDNVIDFTEARAGQAASPPQPASETPRRPRLPAAAVGRAFLAALAGLLPVARFTAYVLLRWIRLPVVAVLGLVAFLALIATPMLWFGYDPGHPLRAQLLPLAIGAGVGSVAIRVAYDLALAALAPHAEQALA